MTRVVGLEIGTTAVRAVQLRGHRRRVVVERAAEITLPAGAMSAGEVLDVPAVAGALRQLWRDGRFNSREVVLGFANARAVVRATELPALPEGELRSSLPFQVGELIPWPVENAQLDFQVVGDAGHGPGDGRLRVLLVAAQLDMLRPLLAAVDGAGLRARRVDLVPFALVDALGPHVSAHSEAIVSVDDGVTNVVVHEGGVARFARTTPAGVVPAAERLVREHALAGELPAPLPFAPVALDPTLGEILDSLEYHRSQPGTPTLDRVVVLGGGAGARTLRDAIADHTGASVEVGNHLRRVAPNRSGRAYEVMAAAADAFAPALGLALGELRPGPRRHIDLLPREVVLRRARRRQLIVASVVLAVLAAALVGLSVQRHRQVGAARAEAARVDRRVAALQTDVDTLSAVAAELATLAQRRQLLEATLSGDVAWTRLFKDVASALPGDVWLMSLNLARGAGGTPGNITLTAKGADQAAPARFLRRMEGVPSLTNVWVSSSSRDGSGGPVTFTVSAVLTPAAASGRAIQYGGGR